MEELHDSILRCIKVTTTPGDLKQLIHDVLAKHSLKFTWLTRTETDLKSPLHTSNHTVQYVKALLQSNLKFSSQERLILNHIATNITLINAANILKIPSHAMLSNEEFYTETFKAVSS